jgi:hypothetical protein
VTLVIDTPSAERLARAMAPAVRARETDRDITVLVLAPAK